jgi:hypothetical protein
MPSIVGADGADPVAHDVAPLTRPVGCITADRSVAARDVGHAVAMSREIPEPVRAAAGLAATVLDEVKKLPETIPGLPVRAVGLAMQAALKLQQEYAGLVARGDELFTGIRGENEPGLATFDDDDDDEPAATAEAPSGYRESAFDRAEAPAPDADVTAPAVVDLDEIAEADSALEEIAIDELVDAGATPGVDDAADAGAIENALLESDAAAVAGNAGGAAAVLEPSAEPVAAVSPDQEDGTATDEGGTPVAAATGVATDVSDVPDSGETADGAAAAGATPVEGYDGFSIAQLRGRLRGYAPATVEALLAYAEATRAREPYLRMLRNRLERLTAQEVEASPLAPRGA